MFKELNYLKKILYSNFTRLRFPHKISYILTYKCNLRCKMCNIWKKEPIKELDLEEIERFFKTSNSFSWVGITGGEPFLRDDVTEVMKVILDNCKELVAIHFATNGTLTSKIIKVVENTLKYKRNNTKLLFTLSVDGPPLLHDDIRGVKGTWNNCINTFKELRKNKVIHARIGVTLSSFNFDRFEETFESIKTAYPQLRFDDINVNIFNKSSFYYNNKDMPDLDFVKILEKIDRILEMDRGSFTINNFLRRRYLRLYKRYVQFKKCPLKCQALSAICILGSQGEIYPCGIYGLRVADIREYNYDLRRIWSSALAKKLSADCSNGICPSCWSPCDAYSTISGSLFNFNLWRG